MLGRSVGVVYGLTHMAASPCERNLLCTGTDPIILSRRLRIEFVRLLTTTSDRLQS